MLQTIENGREGFLCPQCHQDMSNSEMLQIHFQNVHMKQSSTIVKGFFSFARQKIKSGQNTNEPSKPYAQYFSFNSNDYYSKTQYMGFTQTHYTYFQIIRKEKLKQVNIKIEQLLLRIELLINVNQSMSSNANSKERRKYEQGIVAWMEDSVVSICASCSKSFGLSRRKHHCRLDGLVICNQCSRFIPFSIARFLTVDHSIQQLLILKDITVVNNNGSNEDHIRVCMSCVQCLYDYHRQICFNHIKNDEIFHDYERITQAKKDYIQLRTTYVTIVDSLLSGDMKYQLVDAQKTYRQLSISYEKIDSISKRIVSFAENCPNIDDNDAMSKARYAALCRNIRTYSIQILQNFSISTRPIPSDDEIKQARDEQMQRLIFSITGMNSNSIEISEELRTLLQQYHQITQFIQKAKLAGHHDDARLLELNLKELAQAMTLFIQS